MYCVLCELEGKKEDAAVLLILPYSNNKISLCRHCYIKFKELSLRKLINMNICYN